MGATEAARCAALGGGAIQAEEGGGRCLRARARRAWLPSGPGKQVGARAGFSWAGHGIAVGPKGEGWAECVGLGLSPVGVFYFLSLLFFFKHHSN